MEDTAWTFEFYSENNNGTLTPVGHTYVFSSLDDSNNKVREKDDLLRRIARYAQRLSSAYPLLSSPSSIDIYPFEDKLLASPLSLSSVPCGIYNVKFKK